MATASTYQIELSIPVDAPQEQVWQMMVQDIGLWWSPNYHVASTPSTMKLEPWLGGRFYEDCGGGSGVVWGTVTAFEAPKRLIISGIVAPPIGGPATSLLTVILLTDGPERTIVQISDNVIGMIDEVQVEAGWREIFETGLKGYCEAHSPA